MDGFYASMTGLALDLIGATFLSVEAVKLHNIAKLRDSFIVPLQNLVRSPTVTFIRDEEFNALPPLQRYALWWAVPLWLLLHVIMGLLIFIPVIVGINIIFSIDTYNFTMIAIDKIPIWIKFIAYPLGGIILILIVAGLGELVHVAIEKGLMSAVNGLFWIDRRTPDGTIGIIGFGFLFTGFAGQMLGTWLSAATL